MTKKRCNRNTGERLAEKPMPSIVRGALIACAAAFVLGAAQTARAEDSATVTSTTTTTTTKTTTTGQVGQQPIVPASAPLPASTKPPVSATTAISIAPVLAPKIAAPVAASPDGAEDIVTAASQQLDKFQELYDEATKIFGNEHLIISPSFIFAHDIKGRLDAKNKWQAGISGVLLLPLLGLGGGHGADWWPVVTTDDASKVYQAFLDQLSQYQEAENNAETLPGNLSTIANTQWTLENILAARQAVCQEDPEWPPDAQDSINKFCKIALPLTAGPTSPSAGANLLSNEQVAANNTILASAQQLDPTITIKIRAMTAMHVHHKKWRAHVLRAAKHRYCQEDVDRPDSASAAIENLCHGESLSSKTEQTKAEQAIIATMVPPPSPTTAQTTPQSPGPPIQAPTRHNLLLGPAIGVPMTTNPVDIFQYGAAAELGNEAFRVIVNGGLVGRYRGAATFRDQYLSGWFLGLAVSGQFGDELFHYFNGGSNLLARLAQTSNAPASLAASQ